MSNRHYILNGKVAMPVDDDIEWAKQFKREAARVGDWYSNGVRVSTVFLGLNHEFDTTKPPLVFETMIFGEPCDNWCDRAGTWDEAEVMHESVVAALKDGRNPDEL